MSSRAALTAHYERRLAALDSLAAETRTCRDVYWCLEHDRILEHINLMRVQALRERDVALKDLESADVHHEPREKK